MSWSSRIGSWGGRFSPFGRSPTSANAQVTDNDFSYITSEDLAQAERENATRTSKVGPRAPRDTDALIFKHRRVSYPVHFPAYSIDDGELTVGKMREAVAKKLSVAPSESSRIKLFYRGKNLKDDVRTARDEGLRSDGQSELLVVVGEPVPKDGSDSEDGDEDDADDSGTKAKKKRNRKRSKRSKKGPASGTSTPNSGYTSKPDPDYTYAPSAAPPPRPSVSTAPKPVETATQKLDALASTFRNKFVPECVIFLANPPADQAKRAFDHKRLTETILSQVLLKLDGVETEGNEEARQQRKALVKEVQGMLNQLDAVVN